MRKLFILFCFFLPFTIAAQDYTSYRLGSENSINVNPDFGIVLAGGGGDHDEAMSWFLDKANGGDVLIIRASGSDGYNNYFFDELGLELNSVETIVFHSASASDNEYVLQRLEEAEAIWMAGGDQSIYVEYWRDTAVEKLINEHVNIKEGVIGGTSAGMAILGEHYFSAMNGTAYSDDVLEDPYNLNVTLGSSDFIAIPALASTITDTHFDQRERSGRFFTFMGILLQDLELPYMRGIACNEYCAVCIDETGLARCFGEWPDYDDFVYFVESNCEINHLGPEICEPGTPFTWKRDEAAVNVWRANADEFGNSSFDLNLWNTGSSGEWLNWSAEVGQLNVNPAVEPACTFISVQSMANSTFGYYPNPTSGQMRVIGCSDQTVALYAIDGRIAGVFEIINENMDISDLPSGTYVMVLDNNRLKVTKY